MTDSMFFTSKTKPKFNGSKIKIEDILEKNLELKKEFFIKTKNLSQEINVNFSNGRQTLLKTNLDKLRFYKSSKEIIKINKDGFQYNYREGSVKLPDSLKDAGRTIITSSGSETVSRSLHVIEDDNRLRRLTPVEFERLNMFPENHTKIDGISNYKRVFLMGNALVIGIVELLGDSLSNLAKIEDNHN